VRKLRIALVLTAALFVATAVPVSATPPSGVTIEVETSLLGAPSPFVASGPAVDAGLICDSGIVVNASGNVTGSSPNGFNWQGIKHFTCDDGSGEFFVNLQARIDFRKGTTFNWNILRGTGDYEDLHGAGRGVGIAGVPCGDVDACVLDIYDGRVHIDP
jgi:hypothetical protein